MYKIKRYKADAAAEWDAFVPQTRNGTFLFLRSYMDYHADRFCDHSLMIYRKGKLCALLPANVNGNTLYSHGGLTYGGLLTAATSGTADVCEIFRNINETLRCEGIQRVVYKAIPWIYHRLPAEEDLYALFAVCNAKLISRDISSTIQTDKALRFSESRRSGLRKAFQNGLSAKESNDYDAFWEILCNNLSIRYGVMPVHSAEEIKLLKSRFPDNIRLFLTHDSSGKPVGGTVVYECGATVHTQYISASAEGKQLGALDLLFDYLINNVYLDSTRYKYFDFGKSTEEGGTILNQPLIFQKEGFGGRGVCYDTYEWML